VKEKMHEKVDRRGFFGSAGKGLALGVGAVVTAATGAEAAVEDAKAKDTARPSTSRPITRRLGSEIRRFHSQASPWGDSPVEI